MIDKDITGRELDHLSRFAASLGRSLDVDTIICDATEPLMSLCDAERLLIAISGTDARHLRVKANVGDVIRSGERIPAASIALLGTETAAFERAGEMPEELFKLLHSDGGYWAVIPLWAHAHLRGVILVQRNNAGFGRQLQKLLTTAGRQLALTIENSRLLSDLQESYRKLMDTQEELIKAERLAALGQLSATMAHEIRNPLTTIFSAVSQLRRYVIGGEVPETLLNIAEEEATRLKRMVADLLRFARPQKPLFEENSIRDMVYKVEEDVLLINENAEHPVNLVIDGEESELILPCDKEHISRALAQLVDNAAEAYDELPERERTVVLRYGAYKTGGYIEVEDAGTGIPEELLSKVFEPFYSTKATGTGLGLSGVLRIAEDHNGTVEIESSPEIKTTIRLYIQTKK